MLIAGVVGFWYYVESRQAIGFDSFLASNTNVLKGMVIHTGGEFWPAGLRAGHHGSWPSARGDRRLDTPRGHHATLTSPHRHAK